MISILEVTCGGAATCHPESLKACWNVGFIVEFTLWALGFGGSLHQSREALQRAGPTVLFPLYQLSLSLPRTPLEPLALAASCWSEEIASRMSRS